MSRKQSSPEAKRILAECLKQDGNEFCSECGQKNPRWASINLAVFFCIRCSGIHRNMGTHISQVRSTNLDVWPVAQAQFMKLVGNTASNAYWEANCDSKPVPESSTREVERFIRNKYERKRFIDTSVDTPPHVLAQQGKLSAGKKKKRGKDAKKGKRSKSERKQRRSRRDDSSGSDSSDSSSSESSDSEARRRAARKAAKKKKKAAKRQKQKEKLKLHRSKSGDFGGFEVSSPTASGGPELVITTTKAKKVDDDFDDMFSQFTKSRNSSSAGSLERAQSTPAVSKGSAGGSELLDDLFGNTANSPALSTGGNANGNGKRERAPSDAVFDNFFTQSSSTGNTGKSTAPKTSDVMSSIAPQRHSAPPMTNNFPGQVGFNGMYMGGMPTGYGAPMPMMGGSGLTMQNKLNQGLLNDVFAGLSTKGTSGTSSASKPPQKKTAQKSKSSDPFDDLLHF